MNGGPNLYPVLLVYGLRRLRADERRLFLVHTQVKVCPSSPRVVVVQFQVIAAKIPHKNMWELSRDKELHDVCL